MRESVLAEVDVLAELLVLLFYDLGLLFRFLLVLLGCLGGGPLGFISLCGGYGLCLLQLPRRLLLQLPRGIGDRLNQRYAGGHGRLRKVTGSAGNVARAPGELLGRPTRLFGQLFATP